MNKFGIQIERTKYDPLYLFPLAKLCYFKSIFQSPFMSRTFLILHRDSVFLPIYLMQYLWIYSIIIPQFTRKYFSNFSNLQRNITSTERLFILDTVLKPCWGVQHAFERRSARLVLARLRNGFIRRSEPCYMKKFWHVSAQHGV